MVPDSSAGEPLTQSESNIPQSKCQQGSKEMGERPRRHKVRDRPEQGRLGLREELSATIGWIGPRIEGAKTQG